MINIAIIGASGYTGFELIKILSSHSKFNINYISTSKDGDILDKLHPSLKDVIHLDVVKADAKEVAKKCELAFLALPHKTAMGFAKELLSLGVKVVDLSADYRLEQVSYEEFYCPHEDKKNLDNAVYGLPEVYAKEIKNAKLIANPGCYPTVALLGILPFIKSIDTSSSVIIDAKSGISGAGKKANDLTHYVNVNENMFAYKPMNQHRHYIEIKEKLKKLSGKDIDVNFIPHIIPASRGMIASIYMTIKEDINPIDILKEYYKNHQFVRVRDEPVTLKQNVGTNFCDIYAQTNANTLFISASIDNLLRGASSQAVVNANLMYGFSEDEGIPLFTH